MWREIVTSGIEVRGGGGDDDDGIVRRNED